LPEKRYRHWSVCQLLLSPKQQSALTFETEGGDSLHPAYPVPDAKLPDSATLLALALFALLDISFRRRRALSPGGTGAGGAGTVLHDD
jgi:hypothetical protein